VKTDDANAAFSILNAPGAPSFRGLIAEGWEFARTGEAVAGAGSACLVFVEPLAEGWVDFALPLGAAGLKALDHGARELDGNLLLFGI